MKFIHIADTHIGMIPDKGKPWSDARCSELMNSFADIISLCRAGQADLLLIAGDMFHRQPLVRELKEVAALFSSIPDTHIVFIAGNHDYISGVSHLNSFEWPENVVFLKDEAISSVYFEDINTEVYGLSFHHREIHEGMYDNVRPSDPSHINILLAHGGDASNMPINRKAIAGAGFDYIALGHLHKPQDISERIRYAGSLEPLDKNETGAHGFIRGTLTKTAASPAVLESEFVPHAVREYIKTEFTVDKTFTMVHLKNKTAAFIDEHGRDNIYTILLNGFRDPDIEFDTSVLEQTGNILEITDNTEPDYDFDALRADNRDNVIGMYIDAIRRSSNDDEVARKALYYGISALLK